MRARHAGKGESSGSEAGEEELAQYEDMDEVEEGDGGAAAGEDDEEEEEEDEDFDGACAVLACTQRRWG
jgi:hypothetical protein